MSLHVDRFMNAVNEFYQIVIYSTVLVDLLQVTDVPSKVRLLVSICSVLGKEIE